MSEGKDAHTPLMNGHEKDKKMEMAISKSINQYFNDEMGLPDHGIKNIEVDEENKTVVQKALKTNRPKALIFQCLFGAL